MHFQYLIILALKPAWQVNYPVSDEILAILQIYPELLGQSAGTNGAFNVIRFYFKEIFPGNSVPSQNGKEFLYPVLHKVLCQSCVSCIQLVYILFGQDSPTEAALERGLGRDIILYTVNTGELSSWGPGEAGSDEEVEFINSPMHDKHAGGDTRELTPATSERPTLYMLQLSDHV